MSARVFAATRHPYLREIGISGAAALLVILVTFIVVSGGSQVLVLTLVIVVGAGSVLAALVNRPVLLIAMLVATSAGQRAIAASTLDATALWLDDVVLLGIALYAARKITGASFAKTRITIFLLGGLLLVALARAGNVGIGTTQLRQMAVPVVLVVFGMVLTKIELKQAIPIVVVAILIGAIYGVLEQTGWRPINPLGVLNLNQYAHSGSREGLPNSYFYYFADGVRMERSGGLILNPPSFGMLAATGLLWTWLGAKKASIARVSISAILAAAVFFSFGRGGFVIVALALFQPILTRRSGKLAFAVVAVALGYIALSEFSSDGESGRHVDGFFGGLTYALTHPLGGGFGTAGNSLSRLGIENESGANESLAAIFMASLGWAAILIVGWLLLKGVVRGGSLAGVALTSAVLVSLVSETAGGLDATGPLWILAGVALTPIAANSEDESTGRSAKGILADSGELPASRF